jgi:hypothetical protein
MRNVIRWAALAAVCLFVTGCTTASEATMEVLNKLVESGTITAEHRDELVSAAGFGWTSLMQHVIDIGAAVLLAYTGINLRRGPATRQENIEKAKSV